MTYSDNLGSLYDAVQIISSNKLLPSQNGFIYDSNNLTLTADSAQSLVVPFRLDENYTSINVSVNDNPIEFSCYNNSYGKNNLCFARIQSKMFFENLTNTYRIKLTGYDNNQVMHSSVSILNFTSSTNANIITSGINVVIDPDNGTSPQQVFLYNNGQTSATSLSILPTNPVIISSNTCGTTLAASTSCSFFINVTDSIPSGQSNVRVTYNNSQSSQTLSFNVSYISPSISPALTLTSNGNFTNQVVNSGTDFMAINITNTGNVNLTNLLFTNINTNGITSNATGTTCISGQSLAVGSSCVMVLAYNPTSVASGTVNFIPTANYTGQNGETLTYTNSSLSIPYSSIAAASFLTTGDFGMVFSSTAGTPGTWTANVDSPFTTTAIDANGISVNNGTYVMMMSNGTVKYTTQNALFWNTTGATGLTGSTCGVAYDGSFYYICGTGNTSGGCTAANGCVERTNTLSGAWSVLFAENVPSNNIYYYTNGTNKAYIATIATTSILVSGGGLVVSTNGSTWATANSGFGVGALISNNTIASTYNPSTQTVTAWNNANLSTSIGITGITGTWTVSGTLGLPGTAGQGPTSAVYANGFYQVVNANGTVYVSTTPNGAYTLVFTAAGALTGIAYGNSPYIAVGNNGIVLENSSGTWSAQTSFITGQSTLPNLSSVYFESGNNKFWITGVNALASSPPSAPPVWTTPSLTGITKNGSNYLAIDNQGNIFSSANLTSWNNQTNPSGQILRGINCINTNLCFALGDNGTILKSTNGTSWTQLPSGTSAVLRQLTCQFGTCVIVGGSGTSNSGIILTSTDYTSWTIRTSSLATTSLNSVAFYNNQFITVGNAGTIFTSTNSINWNVSTSGTANDLNSIACGNGCAAVGDGGTIIYSGSGNSWQAATSGTTNNLNSVAYNGIFQAVGNGGILRYSTSGFGTWTSGTFPSTSSATNNLQAVISK